MPINPKFFESIKKNQYTHAHLDLSYKTLKVQHDAQFVSESEPESESESESDEDNEALFLTNEDLVNLFAALQSNTSISSINLSGHRIQHIPKDAFEKLVHLKHLDLSGNDLKADSAKVFMNSSLISLILSDSDLGDEGLLILSEHLTLENLTIDDNDITDKGMHNFSQSSKLRYLNISQNSIGDKGIEYVLKITSLTTLIAETCELTARTGELMGAHSSLEKIILTSNKLGDDGASHIAKCKTLNTLALRKNNITNVGVSVLAASNLLYLTLGDESINDEVLSTLINSKALVKIKLFENNITSKGVTALLNSKSLIEISFKLPQFNKKTLLALKQLKTSNLAIRQQNRHTLVDKLALLACDITNGSPSWTQLPYDIKYYIATHLVADSRREYGKSPEELEKLIKTFFNNPSSLKASLQNAVEVNWPFKINKIEHPLSFFFSPAKSIKHTSSLTAQPEDHEEREAKRQKTLGN